MNWLSRLRHGPFLPDRLRSFAIRVGRECNTLHARIDQLDRRVAELEQKMNGDHK